MADVEEVEDPRYVTTHALPLSPGPLRRSRLSLSSHVHPSHASPIATCRVAPSDHPVGTVGGPDHANAVVSCPTWDGVSVRDRNAPRGRRVERPGPVRGVGTGDYP
ncbi:hypothetical protein GCM10009867_23220 [Pedococcus aerophilus]|uniref:Uncharacterized protein n=1 Tax=Pedococcus aerophilus TaxID=436356 RepID=A0ABN3UQ58_9MICO